MRRVEADAAKAYWSAWLKSPSDLPLGCRPPAEALAHLWLPQLTPDEDSAEGGKPCQRPAELICMRCSRRRRDRDARGRAGPRGRVDARRRASWDSLAFDLMEPVRPAVDRYLLDLLERRTFVKEEFFEQLDGHCRLLPPLSQELVGTVAQWGRLALPVAQKVSGMLKEAYARAGRHSEPQVAFTRGRGYQASSGPSGLPPESSISR